MIRIQHMQLCGWPCILAVIVLGLFTASLAVSFFAPIYFDDLGHIIGCSRIGYDSWEAINNQPLCYSHFSTPVPWLLFPGRWLSWFVHSLTTDFVMLRLSALVIFTTWFALAAWLWRRVFCPSLSWLYTCALIAAFCGLGLAPLVMLQGRPEGALLLCVTLYIAIAVWLLDKEPSPRRTVWLIAAILLCMTSWFFSAHSKTLLYLPFVLACCWYLPYGRRARLALMAGVSAIAIQSLPYWIEKLSCDSKAIMTFRKQQGLFPELLLNDPAEFIRRFAENLSHSHYYLSKIIFAPPQGWTTLISKQWWMGYINPLIMLVGACALLLALAGIGRLLWQWKHKHTPAYGAIFFWLFAGMLAQDGLQVFKSFYESTLVWPCLLLLAGFASTLPPFSSLLERYRHIWLTVLFIISGLSMAAFIHAYMPATYKLMKRAPDDRILMHKSHAIAPVHYNDVSKRTVALAGQCGITPDSRSHGVVVDSVTYFALRDTHAPLYQPFYHAPDSVEKLQNIMMHYNSDGLVTACRHLPWKLRKDAKKKRGICCLPKNYFLNTH